MDPQDRSGSLKRVSISDMDENTEKSNIQGVEIHLVKLNNKGHIPTVPVMAGKFMGGEAAFPKTPERSALASARSKYAVHPYNETTGD